ncbi:MAG TPA: M15 family metallopeptidase [Kofleriaceae bacterium]
MVRLSIVLTIAACGSGDDSAMPDALGGTPSIEGTPVSSFETSTCSTSSVLALSIQIAREVDCIMPGQLVEFVEGPAIRFAGSAVLPYLSSVAREALYAAAEAGGGNVVEVTSAFRTVVQQYLLHRWFELGRCAITAAADPGSSNHESGRALDVSNYNTWITRLEAEGWSHSVPGDPVHFDHLTSPDIRGADVLAFQRLWNRNAPDDQITEDGQYGPMTADRVKRAPAEGFGIGALCATRLVAPAVHTATEVECAH